MPSSGSTANDVDDSQLTVATPVRPSRTVADGTYEPKFIPEIVMLAPAVFGVL